MPNRLDQALSPYLLQHKDNPVHWVEWGDEAFAEAKQLDRPVFLSVGYSSCHWCHVMAHESFEDEEVARVLNDRFVCIKVDREERPDVDDAYMAATQIATGRGGWPMTCFLTPDKKPFFAGTYFPKEDRGQYPGFMTLILSVHHAWVTQREDLESASSELAEHLARALDHRVLTSGIQLDASLLESAVQAAHESFDHENGGFGTSPKFPPHTAISFLLEYSCSELGPIAYRDLAREMVMLTLTKMALGGIHDHLAGGFHRYSTDERWLLPHFEKMLYDNAQLLSVYSRAARAYPDDPRAECLSACASGIVRWLQDEMTSAEGLFASAQDADSEGEEGRFAVWSEAEIRELLVSRAEAFLQAYQTEPGGNFLDEATHLRTGHNILHLAEWTTDFGPERELLLERRRTRPAPELDHKAIAAWNGMMIASLAEAGEIELANRCAEAWWAAFERNGYLPRHITRGQDSGLGFLDDYAHLADGFLSISEATGSEKWLERGRTIAQAMLERFEDAEVGGFYFSSLEHEKLFGRPKPAIDGASPCPNSVAMRVLRKLGDHNRHEKALTAFSGWMVQAPTSTESMLSEVLAQLIDR